MDATAQPAPYETIEVEDTTVACDGGDGALGHPRVFLHIEERPDGRSVMCPYCSRLYVLKEGAGHVGGHSSIVPPDGRSGGGIKLMTCARSRRIGHRGFHSPHRGGTDLAAGDQAGV